MPPYADSENNVTLAANLSWNVQPAGPSEHHSAAADSQLAGMYIRMWSLASGRRLRDDVPPEQLSEEELIVFWADNLGPPSGRHAIGTSWDI
jgi:hypothetical protein